MTDAIEKIERYLDGVSRETFLDSDLLQDATIREFMVIGEAAGRLSETFRKKHPDIPFRNIVGMRNILIHEYAGVEASFLWKTYEQDFPALKVNLSH